MSSTRLSDAHPLLQHQYPVAKASFEELNPGVVVVITESYRSPQEQDKLYNQGRTTPGEKVTNAKAFQSPHNFYPSFAIDVAFEAGGKTDWSYEHFASFAKLMATPEITWGGSWHSLKDNPHFEVTGWKDLIHHKTP